MQIAKTGKTPQNANFLVKPLSPCKIYCILAYNQSWTEVPFWGVIVGAPVRIQKRTCYFSNLQMLLALFLIILDQVMSVMHFCTWLAKT